MMPPFKTVMSGLSNLVVLEKLLVIRFKVVAYY